MAPSGTTLVLSTLFLLSLASLCTSQTRTSYPVYNLDDSCVQNTSTAILFHQLPCRQDSRARAGTFVFSSNSNFSCRATIHLDGTLCSNSSRFAVYINVRTLSLLGNNSLDIYENGTLVKHLSGGNHTSFRFPTSVAQLLSKWSSKPALELHYNRGNSSINRGSAAAVDIALDYTIVREGDGDSTETGCEALQGGSIQYQHFCDHSDRVNCPHTYTPTIGLNPVDQVENRIYTHLDYCTRTTTQLSTTTSYPSRTYYPTYDLEDYCSVNSSTSVLVLPCDKDAYQRAGTIRFASYPNTSCNTTLTVDGSLCPNSSDFAIYFNVRVLALANNDSVGVFENGTLVKYLPGGYVPITSGPRSVAQLLSRWSRTPTLNFRFSKRSSSLEARSTFVIDYTILRRDYDRNTETNCAALEGGSMLDKHYCDESDRVNCPAKYNATIDLNPANQTAVTQLPTIPSYCYQYNPTARPRSTAQPWYRPTIQSYWPWVPSFTRTTPSYWPYPSPYVPPSIPSYSGSYYHFDNGLSAVQIGYIVCGSLVCFTGILRLCTYCLCGAGSKAGDRRPLVTRQQGGTVPQSAAQPVRAANFTAGAPPAYSTVFPSGGPMQDAAKY